MSKAGQRSTENSAWGGSYPLSSDWLGILPAPQRWRWRRDPARPAPFELPHMKSRPFLPLTHPCADFGLLPNGLPSDITAFLPDNAAVETLLAGLPLPVSPEYPCAFLSSSTRRAMHFGIPSRRQPQPSTATNCAPPAMAFICHPSNSPPQWQLLTPLHSASPEPHSNPTSPLQGLTVDTLLEVAAASGLEAEIVPRLTAAILYHIHPMDAATPADLLAEGTILTALSGVDPMYTLAVSVCVCWVPFAKPVAGGWCCGGWRRACACVPCPLWAMWGPVPKVLCCGVPGAPPAASHPPPHAPALPAPRQKPPACLQFGQSDANYTVTDALGNVATTAGEVMACGSAVYPIDKVGGVGWGGGVGG